MPYSESQKRATIKYQKEKQEEIRFRVSKDEAEVIKAHAVKSAGSVRAYLMGLIKKDMQDDK